MASPSATGSYILKKALCLIGQNRFHYARCEAPRLPQAHEVSIEVIACGICGTDLSFINTCEKQLKAPIILGHEFVGEVKSLGRAVNQLKKGDKIVGVAAVHCGHCFFCDRGQRNLCADGQFYGFPPFAGGYQQILTLPAVACIPIPSSLDPIDATLTEPMAVSLHAIALAKLQYGMSAAVLGCGPIGLMTIKLLKKMGVRRIIASEPNLYRRTLAKQYGADVVIDPHREDLIQASRETIHPVGVDVVFEVCGKSEGIRLTTQIAKPGACLIMIGIPMDDKLDVSHAEARKKGLTFKMVRGLNHTIQIALKELTEHPSDWELITHRLEPDAINAFVDAYHQPNHQLGKGVLVFT